MSKRQNKSKKPNGGNQAAQMGALIKAINQLTVNSKKANARPSKQRKNKARQPLPSGALALHGPQTGAQIETYFRFKAGTLPQSVVIEGRDLALTAVTASSATPSTFVQSRFVISVDSSPSSALVNRFSSYVGLFQRWRVRKLTARFVANQATTTVGNNYLALAYDATLTVSSAEATMRLNNSCMGNAYSDLLTKFDPAVQLKWYSTNPVAITDQDYPGVVIFGTDGYSASVVPGKIVYDYEIEFAEPK
jgi:hypothetical protein